MGGGGGGGGLKTKKKKKKKKIEIRGKKRLGRELGKNKVVKKN
jgi:hypothetical protein